ncbi:hypothetical protein RDp07_gp66 [Roseobacter phage RD-1410Ws-07]|nr:hypothetical protein RDp07_gp66 [Roseobacter phage RD-1410Ws-07]
MQPFVFRVYDYFWADRPFITATVEIVHVEGSDIPMINYDADATQLVSGTWIASIYEVHDGEATRITSRRGPGSYHNRMDEPRLWTWAAFFDNEQDVSTPDVPNDVFMVCVRYDVEASDSGVSDQTPKFCSRPYDPNDPFLVLEELLLAEEPR